MKYKELSQLVKKAGKLEELVSSMTLDNSVERTAFFALDRALEDMLVMAQERVNMSYAYELIDQSQYDALSGRINKLGK